MSRRLYEVIDSSLGDWGEHPALIEVNPGKPIQVLSAGELRGDIRRAAEFLTRSGMHSGTPVALVLDNSMDFVRVFLALLRASALPVPMSPGFRTLELDEVFENACPPAVVTHTRYLENLRPYLEGRTVVSCERGALRLEQAGSGPHTTPDLGPEVATLNYTYRGYGYPLGCIVTHAQYLHSARVLQEGLEGRQGERMLSILPMHHILSLVSCILVPLIYRMTTVIARTLHPRHLCGCIKEQRVDYVTAVPEIHLLLTRAKDENLRFPALKALVSGGSSLDAKEYDLIRRVLGAEVLHGYGLTEFAPASRNIRGQARAGTVGPVCDAVQLRIDSPDSDGIGQILLNTPSMGKSYFRRPRETSEAFRGDWFQTGDLGRFDGDHLVFVEETKRTCKVNGSMVDLEEVRRAILLDPDVAEAQVRKEDGVLTARIDVASRVDGEQKARQLHGHLRSRISVQKIPRRIQAIHSDPPRKGH